MPVESAQVRKLDDRVIEVFATFPVSPARLFPALTEPKHLSQWMSAQGFALVSAEVDGRAGGGFRYVYRRPSGRIIEVRGAYNAFDPPRGYAYVETYDFSPLRIDVEVSLDQVGDATRYTQTLRYATAGERDGDFEGVASSSKEALVKLARYMNLTTRANRRL